MRNSPSSFVSHSPESLLKTQDIKAIRRIIADNYCTDDRTEFPQKPLREILPPVFSSFLSEMDILSVKIGAISSQNKQALKLMRVFALLQDDHTVPLFRSLQETCFPIEFHNFSDGIYITKASDEYLDLVGKKIVAIENTPIHQVVQKMQFLFAQTHPSRMLLNIMQNLRFPFILK